MLEGVEGEVGKARDVLARRPHAEHSAVVVWAVVLEDLAVGQCLVHVHGFREHGTTVSHKGEMTLRAPTEEEGEIHD